ncbi:MAG: hypothetical protein ACI3XJ_13500 [Oscillospiraceae bacterium]
MEAVSYWGRYTAPSSCSNDPITVENFDILDYDSTIKCLFSQDANVFNWSHRKNALWRETLEEILCLLDNLKNPKDQPSWTDTDFSAAAGFFKNDYPIIESLLPLNIEPDFNNANSCCNYILDLYTPLAAHDTLPLAYLRRVVATARKNAIKENKEGLDSATLLKRPSYLF